MTRTAQLRTKTLKRERTIHKRAMPEKTRAWKHAGPGGHPLHTAGSNHPFVTQMISVAHAPGFHISDGLETTVRVLWKTPGGRRLVRRSVACLSVEAMPTAP